MMFKLFQFHMIILYEKEALFQTFQEIARLKIFKDEIIILTQRHELNDIACMQGMWAQDHEIDYQIFIMIQAFKYEFIVLYFEQLVQVEQPEQDVQADLHFLLAIDYVKVENQLWDNLE